MLIHLSLRMASIICVIHHIFLPSYLLLSNFNICFFNSIEIVSKLIFTYWYYAEEKPTPVGHKIQVLKYLTLGVELTIFYVPVHAYMNQMTCNAIVLLDAMLRNVTFWHTINGVNLKAHWGKMLMHAFHMGYIVSYFVHESWMDKFVRYEC